MSDMTISPAVRNGRFAAFFNTIVERAAQYRLYRKTLDELRALGDRELADLGLNRSMLRSVAYKSAYNL